MFALILYQDSNSNPFQSIQLLTRIPYLELMVLVSITCGLLYILSFSTCLTAAEACPSPPISLSYAIKLINDQKCIFFGFLKPTVHSGLEDLERSFPLVTAQSQVFPVLSVSILGRRFLRPIRLESNWPPSSLGRAPKSSELPGCYS